MDVLVAGGTGFLGRRLCAALASDSHKVVVLSRHPAESQAALGGVAEALAWDPAHVDLAQPWARRIGQVDAIVNLSGENVGGRVRCPSAGARPSKPRCAPVAWILPVPWSRPSPRPPPSSALVCW